jgi:uncharacterized protein (DUF302 family)
MSPVQIRYALSRATDLPFEDAVARVRTELDTEGFSALCEIDVEARLKKGLGVEREPYLIIGACNPALADRALQAEAEVGVLLPCSVVIYQRQGQTHIAAVDAERMLSIVGNDDLAEIATEVQQRLSGVVDRAGNR